MSDKKDDNQKEVEFESAFSSSDDVVDVIVEDESEDYSSSEGFADIDDGVDIEDDEEGIFSVSPQPRKSKKKSSSFGALFLTAIILAVAGAGGYLYLTNPDLVDQIKNNFLGGDKGDSVQSPSFELTGIVPALEESPVVQDIASANESSDMPPQPESIPHESDLQDSSLEETAEVLPPSPETSEPEETPVELALNEETPDAEPVVSVEAPALDEPLAVSEEIVTLPEDTPVSDSAAPVSDGESVVGPQDIKPEKTQSVAESSSESNKEEAGSAKIFHVTKVDDPSIKVVDDISQKTPDDKALTPSERAPADSDLAKTSQKEGEANETNTSPAYYDSPPGKILSNMPAPSLNPQKGKGENIIVVSSSKEPLSAVKSSKNVTIESTSLDSQIIAAGRALKLGRYDAAMEMYEDLYHLNPRDPRILMGRAVCFQKTGQADLAISTYEELLRVDPQNTDAIVNLSGLVRKAHPAEALAKLLDLRRTYPDNPVVAAQLGVAYADSGNLEDAFRYLSLAASIEPDNPLHYYNMAIISEMARDIPKAVSYYEKSLEVDAVHGSGREIPRALIYDRLTRLRGN